MFIGQIGTEDGGEGAAQAEPFDHDNIAAGHPAAAQEQPLPFGAQRQHQPAQRQIARANHRQFARSRSAAARIDAPTRYQLAAGCQFQRGEQAAAGSAQLGGIRRGQQALAHAFGCFALALRNPQPLANPRQRANRCGGRIGQFPRGGNPAFDFGQHAFVSMQHPFHEIVRCGLSMGHGIASAQALAIKIGKIAITP